MAIGFTEFKVQLQKREENKPCTNQHNQVFKVQPKLNQDVCKELQKKRKFFNKMSEDYRNFDDKSANPEALLKKYNCNNKTAIKEKIDELHTDIELYIKRTAVEEKLNDHYQRSKEKTPVLQGESIQLVHFDSNLFMGAKKSMAAEQDKSCTMVLLMESGSQQTIWRIMPSVNHKKQGDIVRYKESVLLINEFNGLYLHQSGDIEQKQQGVRMHDLKRIKDHSPDRKAYYQSFFKLSEVNCSKTRKEWTIELQRRVEEDDNTQLRCGDTIRLKHTAQDGYICADIFSSDLKELNEGSRACYLRIQKGQEMSEVMDTGSQFVLEKGQSLTEQAHTIEQGNIAKYCFGKETTYKYRLRHLISGRYIKMAEIDIIFKNKKKADKQERILGLSKIFEKNEDKENNDLKEFDDHTVFQFYSTSKEMFRPVKSKDQVKIKFFKVKTAGAVGNKIFLGVGNREIIQSRNQMLELVNKRTKDLDLFNRIEDETIGLDKRTILLTDQDKDENSFLIEHVNAWYVDTVKQVNSALGLIHYFVSNIKAAKAELLSNWNDEIKVVLTQMKNIEYWVTGNYKREVKTDLLERTIVLQKISRDLRMIDILVDIVYQPQEVFSELNYKNIFEKPVLMEIQKVAQSIIKNVFNNQTRNEFQAAQWIKLFIKQSLLCDERNSINAEDTLASLIRSNKKLLDKYISEEIIESLIDVENKKKNVSLLSSLCVCKGEAVKSKQNKIIDLFIKSEDAFKQFFIRMDDITVRGKGKLVIECCGKVMKSADFEYLKSSIELVSALCQDRNYKSIEQFNSIYQFFNVFTNFIEKNEIQQDIKSKFVKLTQHLIFDKEPFKFSKLPVYTLDQPPVQVAGEEAEYSSSETVKLMKKFLNNFLNDKNQKQHQELMMLSVMNIVYFMCSHKIQGHQEITVIVKTINDRIYDQISEACGLIRRGETDEQQTELKEENSNTTFNVQYNLGIGLVKDLNTLWFDESLDVGLFTSQGGLSNAASSRDNTQLLKMQQQITNQTPSLIRSLDIIHQVNMSRINDAILKFLTKCNTKQLEIDSDFTLANQLLMQLGIMPQMQYNKIMREYIIMSKPASTLFDDNILKRIDTHLLLHTNLSDLTVYIRHNPRKILATCSIDAQSYTERSDKQLKQICGIPSSEFANQEKLLLPIVWIKDLVEDDSIFDDSESNDKENQIKFNELLISYICSDNYELQISAFKLLIDSVFAIDNFVETLDNTQLIDSDDLKELHKKIDIIARTLMNKIDNLNESKSDNFQELVIYISKMFFFLSNQCINDETTYDSTSNTRTIDKTGAHNVESMFEELYAQGLLDSEIEMNKIEEDMMKILIRLQQPADKEEIENWKKWRYFVFPLKQNMNSEIQSLYFNLKLHEIALSQINQDVSDLEQKPRELIITLKCISYRFLLLMSHKNITILNNFYSFLPTIIQDLKNQLIACQLYTEIICADKARLQKLATNDLSKICQLISSQDEDMDHEKSIALNLLHKFVYYKNEVIKNNQNEIANFISAEKGFNIIPHIFKKTGDQSNDKIPAQQKDEVSLNIMGQLDKQNEAYIKPFMMQIQEFIMLLCVLTEKTNFQTESQVKDLISFSKIITLLELTHSYFDMQVRILQLIIDAFLDLEEVQDNTAIDFSQISGLLKTILILVNQIVALKNDDNFNKQQVQDLIPNGVKNKQAVKTQADQFLFNQVIYLVSLLFKTQGARIQDQGDFKKIIELLSEIDPPDSNDYNMTLNQVILANYIRNYSKNQSCKVFSWLKADQTNGTNPPIPNSKLIDLIHQYIQVEDEQELMRDNQLAQKWYNHYNSSSQGKINNFMKIIMSIVKCNQFYKMISIENLKNFAYYLQSQPLKFSNKRKFLTKIIQILVHNHNYIEKKYIIRALKFLRMFIECQNVKCVNESIQWQTKDYITIEGEVSDSQDILIEVGAAELIVKLINNFSDIEVISESVMLACALLLGGNERSQMAFLALQDNKLQDGQMVKLYDLLNSSYSNIYNTEIGKQSNKLNLKRELKSKIKEVPFIAKEISKDDYEDSTSVIENQLIRNSTLLNMEMTRIQEIDPSQSNFQGFKETQLDNDSTDQKELVFRILKFLQNLCENHNSKLQEFVREQQVQGVVSGKSRNFITLLCVMFKRQLNFISKDIIYLGIQIVDTLVEFIQGPCKNNQVQVVKDKGLDTARDVLYAMRKDQEMRDRGFQSDDDQMQISILKYKTIVLVNSLFEGNKNDSEFNIYDEIPKSIEFEILTDRLIESFCNFVFKYIIPAEKTQMIRDNWDRINKSLHSSILNKVSTAPVADNSTQPVKMADTFKDQRKSYLFKEMPEFNESNIQMKTEWMNDQQLQEGFNISILMMNIADQNKLFQLEMQNNMTDDDIKRSYNFFKINISNIDVFVFDQIWKVQFPIHPFCRQLSPLAKEEFFNTVDRETPMSKLNGLIEESKFLEFEMKQQQQFNQWQLFPSPSIVKLLGNILLGIALLQNLMFIWQPQKMMCEDDSTCDDFFVPKGYQPGEFVCLDSKLQQALLSYPTYMPYMQCTNAKTGSEYFINLDKINFLYQDNLTTFFGFVQILCSLIIFTVWYLNNFELIRYRQWEKQKEFSQYNVDKILKAENIDQEKINDFYEKKIDNLADSFQKQKTVLYLKGPDSMEFIEGDKKTGRNYISFMLTSLKMQHDVVSLIQHPDFLYKITQFIMSIMGTFINPFWFSFHLFDLVQRQNELKNILQAITKNWTMLLTTLMFTLIITYTFTLIGFMSLRDAYLFTQPNDVDDWLFAQPKDYCMNILTCITFNLNYGIRLSGAHTAEISIYHKMQVKQFLYDMGFVLIVPIILIQIVFGIVIDSFGELQLSNQTLKDDIMNVCFICELTRDSLEKEGISFEQHIQYDHNWEFQLQFVVHLHNKDKAFYNGVELEISNMIEQKNVTFFPRKKMFNGQVSGDEESGDDANNYARKLLESTKQIKADIKKIFETMDQKIKDQK